jgi:hypothetical protein
MTVRRTSLDESAPPRPAVMWPYILPNYSYKNEVVVSDMVGTPLAAIAGLVHALSVNRRVEMVTVDRVIDDPASMNALGYIGMLGLKFSGHDFTRGLPGYPDRVKIGHFTATVGRIRRLALQNPEYQAAIEAMEVRDAIPDRYVVAA